VGVFSRLARRIIVALERFEPDREEALNRQGQKDKEQYLDSREDVRGQSGTGEAEIYGELRRASDNLDKARDSREGEAPSQSRTVQSS
jgi:hypothetical protein